MKLETLLELAWGLIANAFGGDWTKATPEWQGAAERWRDAYHQSIDEAKPKPKPDIPVIADFRIVIKQSEYSELWHWRVYGGLEQPLIASNGYADRQECVQNLGLIEHAFSVCNHGGG